MAAPFSLKFGSYTHDPGEVSFSISRRRNRSRYSGKCLTELVRWECTGVLRKSSLANLETAIDALEAAYAGSVGTEDLLFIHAGGSTNTKHTILAASTINGIEVDGPHYSDGPRGLWGFGAEYLHQRTYRLTLTAEVLVAEGGEDIVDWFESITQVGDGGPTWMYQDALEGPLQLQQLTPYSPVHYFQQGRAVGLLNYPTRPAPIGDLVHGDRIRIGTEHPRFSGRQKSKLKATTWSYHMEYAGFAVIPI